MGRGLPSWYKYRAFGPVYEEIRLAEHAARLGSIHTFDRRGDVISQDSFEQGLSKWLVTTGGTGAGVAVSADFARSGGLSARLIPGSEALAFARIEHTDAYLVLSKIGFEFAWMHYTAVGYLQLRMLIEGTSSYLDARIRYDHPSKVWEYYDEDGNWQPFVTDIEYSPYQSLFNLVKLVVDPVEETYVRAITNDVSTPLTSYKMRRVASAGTAKLRLIIDAITGVGGNGGRIYIDDTIFTQNEP